MKAPARAVKRVASDPRGRLLDPLNDFLRDESTGAVALLLATIAALLWANAAEDSYASLWHTELTLGVGDAAITEDLRHWVNDGLMALFFFVVGLEIKRELVTGELNSRRTAALPVLAAVGGAIAPALIFVAIVAGGEGASGWAIPMATDIAFAVGVLALLGDRVSDGVKLFTLAVAVVDDIIAIAIIAGVYTDDLAPAWLLGAAAGVAVVVVMRRLGISRPLAYLPVAIAIWISAHESGVHATIAGVILGLLTPAGLVRGRDVIRDLEHRLHPYTGFVIVPLFALANAGVALGGDVLGDALASKLTWAIVVALVAGKLLGIAGSTFAAAGAGAQLPEGMLRRHALGVGALGGIGFTVSLFIAQLAFEDGALQNQAKVGIFAASIVSAAAGAAVLSRMRAA